MATLTIRWTRQAIADADHIYDFIAADNAAAAGQWSTGSIERSTA
jgi:plasmid stabilization system protein ParE